MVKNNGAHPEIPLGMCALDGSTDDRLKRQFNQNNYPLIWLAGNANGHILRLNLLLGDQKPLSSPKSFTYLRIISLGQRNVHGYFDHLLITRWRQVKAELL